MATKFTDITKIPELRRRILFTLGVFALYRLGVFITVPEVNGAAMSQIVGGAGGGLMGLVNMFTGGALEMMSIFALGIMPYISASIILQLMTVVVPAIERLNKEGEQGRQKITQYTRYGTVILGVIQGFGISFYLENLHETNPNLHLLADTSSALDVWGFRLLTCLTLTAGTVFLMWLGEQITERGIGNGISLLIMGSILAGFPSTVIQLFTQLQSNAISLFTLIALAVLGLGVTTFIVFMETAERRVPLQYAKRMVGRRIYGGQSHHLPLKVNMAGVIPPIFASSMLIFPTTIASYLGDSPVGQWIQTVMVPGDWRYNLIYAVMLIFFTFFYTAVQVNPVDIADNLKKSGAFVPGIRPGQKTADHIDSVLSRLTMAGSIYLTVVCIMPFFLQDTMGVSFFFGGTSLLIAVAVALDTVAQIENHLITRHYDEFGSVSRGDAGGGTKSSGRIKGREPSDS
ncbi:preprotein translocase subunit SecY [Bradymonas sediminis]|uniref:Protein translocase subunit SecY n=1 Tax=Bradymonas sediminis TaxID=1548548 RepID=A0A2Z4FGC0_9DELT|nr:preprotein translocase subunit SecY [Bradymonas sediminis]AWV88002.1 preprotein translocase subunit SecY [Bradymonas sediminis]TDP77125.1 protein translocase subunit secY/sec61 alpha [Bradymonas sediminis]